MSSVSSSSPRNVSQRQGAAVWGVIGDRQAVAAEQLTLLKGAVGQVVDSVLQVDTVDLNFHRSGIGQQTQAVQDAVHLLGKPAGHIAFDLQQDLLFDFGFVLHRAVRRVKPTGDALERMGFQEVVAELDLIDLLAIVPIRPCGIAGLFVFHLHLFLCSWCGIRRFAVYLDGSFAGLPRCFPGRQPLISEGAVPSLSGARSGWRSWRFGR